MFRRYCPLAFLIIFVGDTLCAQHLVWKKTYDGGYGDYGYAFCADSSNNVIVTGVSMDVRDYPYWLTIKYAPNGDTVWIRRFDAGRIAAANGVAADRWGNVIVAGQSFTDSSGRDFCTVKYDSNGTVLWVRSYSTDTTGNSEADGVAVDSKGNIIVTGGSDFQDMLSHLSDYLTLKYDSGGNLLWMRQYNYVYEDWANAVAVDDSDNVVITGISADSSMSLNWDACTIKYSKDGDTLWTVREDYTLDDWPYGVAVDRSTNDVVICGQLGSIGLIRNDGATGTPRWKRSVDQPGTFTAIAIDGRGNICLACSYGDTVNHGDFYAVKCNSAGDTLWTAEFNGGYYDIPRGVTVDREGDLIISGGSYNGPPETGVEDFLTLKYASELDGVKKYDRRIGTPPPSYTLSQNYPNPFNGTTDIRYLISDIRPVSLRVYDILGREVAKLVDERKAPGEYIARWNADAFPSGVYLYGIVAGRFSVTRKMILMR